MDGWITRWRQKTSRGRRRPWPWLVVAGLLLLAGTGWGVVNYTWKQVTLQVDGREIITRTFAGRVGEFLKEQHVVLGAGDVVSPGVEAPVAKDMVITVTRAVPVRIYVDGEETEVMTPPVTVGEVLSKAGIILHSEDRVTPGLSSIITSGASIKVTRVTYKTETVNKEINYRVERRPDTASEKGITHVVQKGQKGLQEETFRVIYEDGQEVGRELVASKVIKEAVPEIVAVGTIDTASRGGQTFRFERVFWAVATAYTHTGSPTATGVYPRVGTIAVDPSVIPLGSRLYVEGYGFGIAQDVGSAIKGNRIDVFLDTREATARWGIRRVKVYVLR